MLYQAEEKSTEAMQKRMELIREAKWRKRPHVEVASLHGDGHAKEAAAMSGATTVSPEVIELDKELLHITRLYIEKLAVIVAVGMG